MADTELKQRLCALMSVKSIIPVALTAVFAVLALSGRVTADQYMTVFSVVIAFYFGTQAEKNKTENDKAPL